MNNTADVTITGEASGDFFGSIIASAGDVNGDGYSDVIVGAGSHSSNTGRAYIFYGSPSLSSGIAATDATVIMNGEAPGDVFGNSVASAGDVNGDGYCDVIIGAHFYDPGIPQDPGRAYIFYGGASMNNTADVTITGEAANNHLGDAVASAGDVNGDGYSDVIVAATAYSSNTGRAYIFYGSSSMSSTIAATAANVTMTGTANSKFGQTLSSADVNADGFQDLLIYSNTAVTNVYIYYQVHNMNTTANKTMTGETTNNNFGYSAASAGDVNGDGYSDVIVGAYGYDGRYGRAYIFYGGPGMDTTADVTFTGETSIDTINFDFGASVASAGDVNGDGYSDVIIGARGYLTNTGRVYIFYGGASISDKDLSAGATADVTLTGGTTGDALGASVSSAGDVNGDGYSDVIIGARGYSAGNTTGRAYIYYGGTTMDGTADVTLTGETTSNYFGYSVASAGDVNGDGYNDVIVGADGYSTNTGRAYIFYGGASMTSKDLGAGGTADVTMTGQGSGAASQFGYSVASVRDVNGDGYSDVIVGFPNVDLSGTNEGSASIFYGGANMDTTADVTISGEASSNLLGTSVASAGDVNGDGYADVIVGAYGNTSSTGKTYLTLGGESTDFPTFNFAKKSATACTGLASIAATWNGQSNVAASSDNIVLQTYHFGSTNAWETVTTNSALAADTDGDVTGTQSTAVSEYCDGSNWTYWRVYQASGTQTLQADYINFTFTDAPPPQTNINNVELNNVNFTQ
jgi:hypothetical protein